MNEDLKNFFMVILFGFITCLIFGLLFYGTSIINIHDARFQVIILGFYGSVVYGFMKYKKPKELIYLAVILLVVGITIHGKAITSSRLLMEALLIATVFASMYLYRLYLERNKTIPVFLRSFVLMLLYGLSNTIMVALLSIIHNPKAEIFNLSLLMYSKVPALCGLSLGIGFDIFEVVKNNWNVKRQ